MNIPAGIKVGETEFFWEGETGYAMHEGVKVLIEDLPEELLSIVDRSMNSKHLQALDGMGIVDLADRRKQFLKCNCSAYDFTPDIVTGRLTVQTEFVECPFRNTCAFQGTGCQPITIEGRKVTMAELRITSLIRKGQYDKEICDALGIAEQTLRIHKKNIQNKLNADRKPQVALRAVEYGII